MKSATGWWQGVAPSAHRTSGTQLCHVHRCDKNPVVSSFYLKPALASEMHLQHVVVDETQMGPPCDREPHALMLIDFELGVVAPSAD